ncbi:42169_t:CDS:2 [Gigaspora margarita]|uniref:42169_t:CDS:1 n=1 Tax=Gigaspora margarita TaxID=4874 RepID=A0ABN7UTD9_GIGMA|nr:42169_t:CDS:2 [Gigaspora margarita]
MEGFNQLCKLQFYADHFPLATDRAINIYKLNSQLLTKESRKTFHDFIYASVPIKYGLLSNKVKLHVLPHYKNPSYFTHQISYNTRTDAYYENDLNEMSFLIKDSGFLKYWRSGMLDYEMVGKKWEEKENRLYLAKDPRKIEPSQAELPASAIWKFDYRSAELIISTLSIKFQNKIFNVNQKQMTIEWSISPLPTRKNPYPIWNPINIESSKLYTENDWSTSINITKYVKGEYGFLLQAYMSGPMVKLWRNKEMFSCSFSDNAPSFGMNLNVVLKREKDIKYGILPKINTHDENVKKMILNDKTSKTFYVHSKVLSLKSNYFCALFNSKMMESNDMSLSLKDVSYNTFKTILDYLYTGNINNISTMEEWIDLLYASSRFLISSLTQLCEKNLVGFINDQNADEFTNIAIECGAQLLLKYCELLEVKTDNGFGKFDVDKKKDESKNLGSQSLLSKMRSMRSLVKNKRF